MKIKLKGICRFCKNKYENIYGEQCRHAHFKDHGGGYGQSWVKNECKHDSGNVPLKDLFDPISEFEAQKQLEEMKLKLEESIRHQDSLLDENRKLRSLIK